MLILRLLFSLLFEQVTIQVANADIQNYLPAWLGTKHPSHDDVANSYLTI
jgi:hypothetical protein